jgi:hypothetical protein
MPETPLISRGPKLLVRFITDATQRLPQRGWAATYVRVSLSHQRCAAVDAGHEMTLQCPAGYKISKVNFASYGTPIGSCGNDGGPGRGAHMDANG